MPIQYTLNIRIHLCISNPHPTPTHQKSTQNLPLWIIPKCYICLIVHKHIYLHCIQVMYYIHLIILLIFSWDQCLKFPMAYIAFNLTCVNTLIFCQILADRMMKTNESQEGHIGVQWTNCNCLGCNWSFYLQTAFSMQSIWNCRFVTHCPKWVNSLRQSDTYMRL